MGIKLDWHYLPGCSIFPRPKTEVPRLSLHKEIIMRHWDLTWIAMGTVLCLAGCNTQNGAGGASSDGLTLVGHGGHAAGGVAVIDLDVVAKRLGRDVDMANSVQQRQNSLNQQLAAIQSSFQKQLDETKKEFGEEPTDEQTQQLVTLSQQMRIKLNETQQQARNNLGLHRQAVINQFREEVKPLAQSAAAERGLGIVVTKNDAVIFAHAPSVDISDSVAEKMLANATQKQTGSAASSTASPPVESAPHVANRPGDSSKR
jgi:Skp family chaperone for outer membrane proteins